MGKYEKLQEFLKKNKKTWLITGVAGFIGSNLLEKLLTLNQKVVGLDNFETGYEKNLVEAIQDANNNLGKDLSNNFHFIKGDINELNDCIRACKNVDYVLHQAALGSVPRSIKDPINTNKANVDGFLNMLLASKDAKVKRFVYASSSSVYGDHADLPKIENQIGNPLSPYAVTKVVCELYANVFSKNYNIESIGLRYFNIFGKRQDPNGAYAAVIPKWIASMIKNENIYINGDGKTSRDFCYIENAVQINLLAAISDNKSSINQVYNVALDDSTSLNELYKMIKIGIMQRVPGTEIKEPIYQDFRLGDVKHSQANINKARTLLGYDPKYIISKGINKSLDWYVKNLSG